MIPIEYYKDAYYFITVVFSLIALLPLLFNYSIETYPNLNRKLAVVTLLIISILFIGLRDPYESWHFFGDTSVYTLKYDQFKNGMFEINHDYVFYYIMQFFAQTLQAPIELYYTFIAACYVILPIMTFKKWFGKHFVFIVILNLSMVSFFPFGINTVRSGLATALFLFALSYFFSKKSVMYMIMVLSLFIHISMILPISVFIFGTFLKNIRFSIYFWFVSVILNLLVGTQIEYYASLLSSQINFLKDDRFDLLYDHDVISEVFLTTSFRIDFVLYGAIPIIYAYWFINRLKFQDKLYNILVNTYIICNAIWILLMYRYFTDRLAYLSWFLMSVILFYPVLKSKLHKNQSKLIFLTIVSSFILTIGLYLR